MQDMRTTKSMVKKRTGVDNIILRTKMVEKLTVKQIDAKIRQLRKQIREIKEQEAKSVE
jgi:hypothetical protein